MEYTHLTNKKYAKYTTSMKKIFLRREALIWSVL